MLSDCLSMFDNKNMKKKKTNSEKSFEFDEGRKRSEKFT